MIRRDFLKAIIAASNGLIALLLAVPGLGYLLTPIFRSRVSSWIKIGASSDFSGDDPAKATFQYVAQTDYSQKERKGFVWVLPSGEEESGFKALSAVCSHTGCNVAWQSTEGKFVCPCHEGKYDKHGNVISGPPPKPLTSLPVKIENGQISIKI